MSRINQIYYSDVSTSDFSCYIHFTTSPIIPAEATFHVNVNNSWILIFPNEVNPGEYYQRVYDLKNGDNLIQIRIEYEGIEYLSDKVNVLVEGQEPEITPPRTPTPPTISVGDISILRRLPCKINYAVSSEDPIIAHYYSTDNGASWDEIQPAYSETNGDFYFSLYYKIAGEYQVLLKVIDDYWDESEIATVNITVTKGEGDEPGLIACQSKEFTLSIAQDEGLESQVPSIYYVVNCGGYTSKSLAEKEKAKLKKNGYNDVVIEKKEV